MGYTMEVTNPGKCLLLLPMSFQEHVRSTRELHSNLAGPLQG